MDGTKVKANASRHKAMSYSHMLKAEAELKAQIAALLDPARSADEAEKNEPELDIPAEIAQRQDRLNAIAQARARLEQRQRDADLQRGRSDEAVFEQLADSGAQVYGASWCPHCQEQKRLFGASQDRLPYVECSPGGRQGGVAASCDSAGVRTYPTWVFPDGSRVTAVMSLRELADRVGYKHASEAGANVP